MKETRNGKENSHVRGVKMEERSGQEISPKTKLDANGKEEGIYSDKELTRGRVNHNTKQCNRHEIIDRE